MMKVTARYTFWCHDKQTGAVFDMGLQDTYLETKACRDDVVKVDTEHYEYGPPQAVGTPAYDFKGLKVPSTVTGSNLLSPNEKNQRIYTFWCKTKDGHEFDVFRTFPQTYDDAEKARKTITKMSEHAAVSGIQTVAYGNPWNYERDARAAQASSTVACIPCCLSWCAVLSSDHSATRTDRCLDYAMKKEIIDKRLSIFRSVTQAPASELEWATKKTAEELGALERQWRSLDPDQVGSAR
jgi:hypothetical protein